MVIPISITQESVSDTEFVVTEVYYKSGDKVSIGDVVFTYETSKADIDIESPEDGFIVLNIHVGDKIYVGDKVGFIVDDEKEVLKLLDSITERKRTGPNEKSKNISKKAAVLIKKHRIDLKVFSNLNLIKESDVRKYIVNNLSPLQIEKANPNDIIIVGARGGAKMIIDAVKSQGIFNVKYLLDDAILDYDNLSGFKILGSTNLLDALFDNGYRNVVLAFGTISQRRNRLQMYKSLAKTGWSFPNIIHGQAMLESSVIMGKGNIVLAGSVVGSDVVLGDYNFINTGSIVSHECRLKNNVHTAPGCVLAGRVSVGSSTLIGMNATIYFDINVGENVTINNGVVINEDISNNLIIKL